MRHAVTTHPRATANGHPRKPYAPRLPPELRREQALTAALSLITEGGMAMLSMEAVAARLGVAKTVVYKAFANTEELLVALIDREQRRAVQQVRQLLPFDVAALGGEPVEATTAGVLAFLESVRASADTWHLLVVADGLPPAAAERRRLATDTIERNVATLIPWATSQRRSGPLDPDLSARTLVAFVETVVRLSLEQPDTYSTERINGFVQTVLYSNLTG